jgi:spore germination protein GerM
MNMQKVILTGLFILWILLIVVFTLIHKGFFPQSVNVYFFTESNNSNIFFIAERQYRSLPGLDKKIKYVIDQLIKGPDDEETKEGVFSLLPPGSVISDVRTEDNVAYLDFNKNIEEGGGIENIRGRLAQIVFTATQFPQITKVWFLIDGKQIKSFSGEGITEVEKALGREDFPEFVKGG